MNQLAPTRPADLLCTLLLRGVSFLVINVLVWLLMQMVHESGHVLVAWATGGTIEKLDLHPLHISTTYVWPNPRPLIVTWAGPIAGTVLPLVAWSIVRNVKPGWAALLRYFAGFCLIANGAYLGSIYWIRVGDAADLLALGTPPTVLILFGIVTVVAGFACWNGTGHALGWSLGSPAPTKKQLIPASVALLVVAGVELLVFR